MKSIPSKKHSIFILSIAVIIAVALFGGALTFSASGKDTEPDRNALTETSSDNAQSSKDEKSAEQAEASQAAPAEKEEEPSSSNDSSEKVLSGEANITQETEKELHSKTPPAGSTSNEGNTQNSSGNQDTQNTEQTRYAYLTFDDGPSKNTDAILKILAENNIKATFFITARNTDEVNLQRCRKIVEAGHTLAMHSGTHNYKEVYASKDAFLNDYARISDLVYELTGSRSLIYRFPGGSSNTLSCRKVTMTELIGELHKRGVEYFDWNVNSTDASGKNPDPSVLVSSVVSGLKYQHNIILMHDAAGHETTVEALPKIIQACRERNLTFSVITPQTPPAHHPRRD